MTETEMKGPQLRQGQVWRVPGAKLTHNNWIDSFRASVTLDIDNGKRYSFVLYQKVWYPRLVDGEGIVFKGENHDYKVYANVNIKNKHIMPKIIVISKEIEIVSAPVIIPVIPDPIIKIIKPVIPEPEAKPEIILVIPDPIIKIIKPIIPGPGLEPEIILDKSNSKSIVIVLALFVIVIFSSIILKRK